MPDASLRQRRNAVAQKKRESGLPPAVAAALAIGGVTAALLVGRRASPGPDHPGTRRWYRRLDKPDYTPPSPVYPVAWTAIQACQAYGGYRLLTAEPTAQRNLALSLWAANQIGIGGWSEVFFGQRAPGWGTVASAALGASAAAYMAAARPIDPTAATFGAPLVAWVSFATLLSEEIWRKNEPSEDSQV